MEILEFCSFIKAYADLLLFEINKNILKSIFFYLQMFKNSLFLEQV